MCKTALFIIKDAQLPSITTHTSHLKIGGDPKQIAIETILPPLPPKQFHFKVEKGYKILVGGT